MNKRELRTSNQAKPKGYCNIERMIKFGITKGTQVKICGSCAEAWGLKHTPVIEGVRINSMRTYQLGC